MKRHIFIPYNHESTSLYADFIFQTASQLITKGYDVHLIFKLHPHYFFLQKNERQKEIATKVSKRLSHSPRLHLYFPPKIFPDLKSPTFRYINIINQYIFFHSILSYIYKHASGIIWSFDPENDELFKNNINKNFINVFDCVDYFTSFEIDKSKKIQKQLVAQIKFSDYVFANSRTLLSFCIKENKNSFLVPQGFDIDSFTNGKGNIRASEKKLIQKIKKTSQIKIGYVGNLTYRFNFQLLLKLIKKNPQHLFIFTDSYLEFQPEDTLRKTKKYLFELKRLKNIIWIPATSRKNLGKWMRLFDICIIPYDTRLDFNKYCYPMKLFEYFYFGKPIISTPIKELKNFNKNVYIGNTVDEWEKYIAKCGERTLSKNDQNQLKILAEKNSWDKKVSKILEIISPTE